MPTLEMAGEWLPTSTPNCTHDTLNIAERSSCTHLLLLCRFPLLTRTFNAAHFCLSICFCIASQVHLVINILVPFAGIQPTVSLEPWQLQSCM